MVELDKLIINKFNVRSTTDNLPWMISKTRSGDRIGRQHIAELFKEADFFIGAEIGIRKGKFSKLLCDKNPTLKLYCIDPWLPYGNKYTEERQNSYYKIAVETLTPYGVSIVRKTSMDALGEFPDGILDFVYIDGNHEFDYVCPDIVYWTKKVRKGGIVAVHDYYHFHLSGIVEAVDAYTKCHCISPWYVTKELEPTAFWVNP